MHCVRETALKPLRDRVFPRLCCLLLVGTIAVLQAGCVSHRSATSLARTDSALAYTLWVGPFAVRTASYLDEDGPEAAALRAVHRDISTVFGKKPVHEPIEVFLFEDRADYESFLRSQGGSLPHRRALFVTDGTRRKIYAHHSRELDRDLRHEAAHAILHARYGPLPLWLDEGLAEFFEVPGEKQHLQPTHVEELVQASRTVGWQPSLRSLEAINDIVKFQRRHYAEAWLWVHFLLQSSPETRRLLVNYAERFAAEQRPFSETLNREFRDANGLVLVHLGRLAQICRQ